MHPDWPAFDTPTLRLAEAHSASGSWKEAQAVLEACEGGDLEEVAARFLLGIAASRRHDWEHAALAWARASVLLEELNSSGVEDDLLGASIVTNLGVAQWVTGDIRSGQACWAKALTRRVPRPETMTNLGLAHLVAGRAYDARQTLEVALRHAPGWAPALVNFGVSMALSGALEEAEIVFVRAIGLADDLAEARKNLSRVYRLRGQEHEAVTCWNRASRDPDRAQVKVGGWFGVLALVERPVPAFRTLVDRIELPTLYVLDDPDEECDRSDEAMA